MNYLVDREIHVIGIQRTGQHAITSWLIGHFDSVFYKNCMSQLGQQKNVVGIQPPFWSFSGDDEKRGIKSFEIGHSALVLGTEFTVFDVGLNPKIPRQKEKLCHKFGADNFSKREDYVLVLRNPYNQYASILNWGKNRLLSPPKSFAKMWTKMAKECAGESNVFENRTTVIYDDWFEHPEYRRKIEERLDLPQNDDRLNTVMKIGHGRYWGSSFDGMEAKKEAQKMGVLNRWESSKDDDRFIELCKNEELVNWAGEYGWECPL